MISLLFGALCALCGEMVFSGYQHGFRTRHADPELLIAAILVVVKASHLRRALMSRSGHIVAKQPSSELPGRCQPKIVKFLIMSLTLSQCKEQDWYDRHVLSCPVQVTREL